MELAQMHHRLIGTAFASILLSQSRELSVAKTDYDPRLPEFFARLVGGFDARSQAGSW
jgi:hypothetical protein